jgi:hypothetical protein
MTSNNKITIYLNVLCPYAQRVWQAAVEKGLDFESISIPLRGDKPDWCVLIKRSNKKERVQHPNFICAGTGR